LRHNALSGSTASLYKLVIASERCWHGIIHICNYISEYPFRVIRRWISSAEVDAESAHHDEHNHGCFGLGLPTVERLAKWLARSVLMRLWVGSLLTSEWCNWSWKSQWLDMNSIVS
jgi:hypothetical protein